MVICFIADYYDYAATLLTSLGYDLKDLNKLFIGMEQIKQGSWAILTILLSALLGYLSQIPLKLNPIKKAEKIQKIVEENHLEKFIVEAAYTQFPIAITLGTRKVYIGICLGDELINSKIEHIAIIPLLSGHRDKDDLSVEITNNYQTHYVEEGIEDGRHKELRKENFRIIIPTNDIESFSFFDVDTYIKFKKKELAKKKQRLSDNTYPNTYYSSIKYSSNMDQSID